MDLFRFRKWQGPAPRTAHRQDVWYIDGKFRQTNTMSGATVNGPVMVSDANGSSTTWAPNGAYTLNAEYIGDPVLPQHLDNSNESITISIEEDVLRKHY